MMIFGACLAGASLLTLVTWTIGADLSNRATALWTIPFAVVCALGLGIMVTGLVIRQKGIINDRLMHCVVEEHITDLEELSKAAGLDFRKTCQCIEGLIHSDLIPNAYLYYREKQVIVPGLSDKIAIRCQQCGGTTVLRENEPRICCYCGGEL